MSWKVTAQASRDAIQAALVAHEDAFDWDHEVVLSGREIAEDRPDEWVLEAWLARTPSAADIGMISELFSESAPEMEVEELPEEDWVTLSQLGVDPIRAGRFYVHTPEFPPETENGVVNFNIPASQAFGTGQHETTAGCLAMLDAMKERGVLARNIADIGTGTGLLAFAALSLWPRAYAIASDIDDVCIGVVEHNAAINGIAMGQRAGELAMLEAAGMDHPLLEARAPYDLLIANILAGPLVELAPDFAKSLVPGGSLLLAGLLESQEAKVRRAYSRAGLRLAARIVNRDWSILWLRSRAGSLGRETRASRLPKWARQM